MNKKATTYNPNIIDNVITRWNENDQKDWKIGDLVDVTIKEWNGYKYYINKATMKLIEGMTYDPRPDGIIPREEKAWSNTQKKLVPNRYLWKVEWVVNEHSFF